MPNRTSRIAPLHAVGGACLPEPFGQIAREELVDGHRPLDEPLVARVIEKFLDDVAIPCDAVGPRIFAHELQHVPWWAACDRLLPGVGNRLGPAGVVGPLERLA